MSTSAPADKPVKVIYVMGSGHSGSTILGVALGNCRGMFFAGELHEFLARSGMPVLGGLERTRFWAQVRERTPLAVPLYGPRVLRLLERSSAALRLSALPAARALCPRYRAAMASIFSAIAELAPASYVIDSSHFPLRARQLQQTPGVELHLIFLVREPQPVVTSITRLINQHEVARRRLMTLKTNADLWLTYGLSLAVFRRQPPQRRMLVHFEDLIATPEAVLAQILAHVGADPQLPDLEALRTGLAIHGNRFIQQELVAFKRSPSTGAPERRGSALTALAQRPWQAVFARLRPAASRVAGD